MNNRKNCASIQARQCLPQPIQNIFHTGSEGRAPSFRSVAVVLVVDDESIARHTLCTALNKAHLRSISVDDPLVAFRLLEENSCDLIFSDIEMPGLNGFEFCAKVHSLPRHKLTPLIFVTSLADFENRARSTLSGGTDLIAKPFLLVELAVKALTYVLRKRVITDTPCREST